VQFHRQRSLPPLLHHKHRSNFEDPEKAEGETGEKDSIQKGEIPDAWEVARNCESDATIDSSMVIGIFRIQSNCETSIQNTTIGIIISMSSGTKIFQI
jgi:hypothetical protein